MKLHPQVIEKDGRNEFVVLPFDEYQKLAAIMYDYEDLRNLRAAKEEAKGQESMPLGKVVADLDL